MDGFIEKAREVFNGFSVAGDGLDILLISALVFFTFRFLLGCNSPRLIKAFVIILTAGLFTSVLGLEISRTLIVFSITSAYIAVVVLYSSELKREIWSANKRHSYDAAAEASGTEEELTEATEEIVKAVQNMAKRDIGALIVFVNNQAPAGILESGTELNAKISSQLIESIFIPKSPLHDGAVLIKGNKILAAGCFLPLSQETNLPKEFGTRHRAAIGITEIHNVTAIVVSEETGIISIAHSGSLKRYIDGEMLAQNIKGVYGLTARKGEGMTGSRWRKRR